MGLTVTKRVQTVIGDRRLHIYDIVGDSSHAAGGEDLTLADIGFASTTDDEFCSWVPPVSGYVAWWDYANAKFQVYQQTDSDNNLPLGAADTADLQLITFTLFALGRFQL